MSIAHAAAFESLPTAVVDSIVSQFSAPGSARVVRACSHGLYHNAVLHGHSIRTWRAWLRDSRLHTEYIASLTATCARSDFAAAALAARAAACACALTVGADDDIRGPFTPRHANGDVWHWPPSLRCLPFENAFNQPLDAPLPASLTALQFGARFNQSLGLLSPLLVTLVFGAEFNRPLHPLPVALRTLRFGQKLNQPIVLRVLPPALQTLGFSSAFERQLLPNVGRGFATVACIPNISHH